MEGYLYCIKNECYDYVSKDMYKIGKTVNLERRMYEYNNIYPKDYELCIKKEVKDIDVGEILVQHMLLEKKIKKELYLCRIEKIEEVFERVELILSDECKYQKLKKECEKKLNKISIGECKNIGYEKNKCEMKLEYDEYDCIKKLKKIGECEGYIYIIKNEEYKYYDKNLCKVCCSKSKDYEKKFRTGSISTESERIKVLNMRLWMCIFHDIYRGSVLKSGFYKIGSIEFYKMLLRKKVTLNEYKMKRVDGIAEILWDDIKPDIEFLDEVLGVKKEYL